MCGTQMESSHPEVVAAMLVHAAAMFVVGPDGKVRSERSGSTHWEPRLASAQMTETFPEQCWGGPSAAAECCRVVDFFSAVGQPYCAGVSCGSSTPRCSPSPTTVNTISPRMSSAELPAAILEIIKHEPAGATGFSFRRYVRASYLPAVRRVSAILRSHGATIEVRNVI